MSSVVSEGQEKRRQNIRLALFIGALALIGAAAYIFILGDVHRVEI